MNLMPDEASVLIASADGITLDVMTLIFRRAGIPVVAANSGAQAVDKMRDSEEPIFLAVIDLEMPDPTGQALLDRLREYHRELRALFLIGDDAPADLPPGCDFLAKPFTA